MLNKLPLLTWLMTSEACDTTLSAINTHCTFNVLNSPCIKYQNIKAKADVRSHNGIATLDDDVEQSNTRKMYRIAWSINLTASSTET